MKPTVTDNPYQSPKSEPEVEKPPEKPPPDYVLAGLMGLFAFGGVVMLQAIVVEIVLVQTGMDRSPAAVLWLFPAYGLIACPVGILFVRWALRDPWSRWLFVISSLLGTLALTTAIMGGMVLLVKAHILRS
jgi:hypothetical protein